MKLKERIDVMADLHNKNKLFVRLIIALMVLVFLLTLYILTTGKQHSVVIIPKGLDQTVMVGQSEANEEYLIAMGSYVTYLFLNFNGNTVVNQYDILASLSSGVVRAETVRLAEDYKKTGISSRVIIQNITVTDQTITVKGHRQKFILDKVVEERNFTLNIKYQIRFSSFRISELELI